MCVMVYLASDTPLKMVPWMENAPAFNVTNLSDDETRVAAQLTTPFLACAGSYEGYGCGFQYSKWPAESYSTEELTLCRRSLEELADQVVEGSFEHALNEIVEEHLDLSVFDHRSVAGVAMRLRPAEASAPNVVFLRWSPKSA